MDIYLDLKVTDWIKTCNHLSYVRKKGGDLKLVYNPKTWTDLWIKRKSEKSKIPRKEMVHHFANLLSKGGT